MTSTVAILDVSPIFDSARGSTLSQLQGAPVAQPLATRRFGDQPLLTWMVRRISHAQQISRVVVVGNASLRQQTALVEDTGAGMIASNAVDPLARLSAAVREISQQGDSPSGFLRVSIDSPFVDPALLDGLAIEGAGNPNVDYVTYRTDDDQVSLAKLGLAGEWFRAAAVERADREAAPPMREEPLQFIVSRPDLFQLRLLAAPVELCCGDLRLAVKTPEDWDHVQAIREALDGNARDGETVDRENVNWRHITTLLDQQSGMRRRMAELNATSRT